MRAFHLTDKRVLAGHIDGGVVKLKNKDGSLVANGELLNGEAVAVVGPCDYDSDHVLVSRQDGVHGYARVRHLHVQAWRLERRHTPAAALTSSRFTWVWAASHEWAAAGQGTFTITNKYIIQGESRHAIHVHGSHAFTVDSAPSLLFLLRSDTQTAVVAWDGSAGSIVAIAHIEGACAAAAAVTSKGPDSLGKATAAAGWAGVFTWAAHEHAERVGLQWSVSGSLRTYARDSSSEAITFITPHAWHQQGTSGRVYMLDESDGETQRAVTVWGPTDSVRPSHCRKYLALPTVVSGLHGAPADAWKITAGRTVLAGNVTHDSGGTILRRSTGAFSDVSLLADIQVFDGDALQVLEIGTGTVAGWLRVAKPGVGDGWLSCNNVHVQGHGSTSTASTVSPVAGLNMFGLPLPAEWQQPQDANLMLAALEPGTALWVNLESRLRATVPSAVLRQVEQIQNVRLYQLYSVQKALLRNDHEGVEPVEKELWHGTGATPPHMIFNGQEGFDMRFCQSGLWGIASYFAEQASYSNADKYCYKNSRGERELLIAQVLVGHTVELMPDASLRMPPEMPCVSGSGAMPGMRYDSVTGVGGGGGHTRVYMIYRHDRAYPKYRLTYVTDRDPPPSPAAPPTDRRRSTQTHVSQTQTQTQIHVSQGLHAQPSQSLLPASVPAILTTAAGACGVPLPVPPHLPPHPEVLSTVAAMAVPPTTIDKFSLYLRPGLPLATSRWAGWTAAAAQQHIWGGLHVTLCSFAPKLSSGTTGHHGGSLVSVLNSVEVQRAVTGVRLPSGVQPHWQLSEDRHGVPVWYTRGGITMIRLPRSSTLDRLCRCVLEHGLVNARAPHELHLTLGNHAAMPAPKGGFPTEGATQPLPRELHTDLCEASWRVTIAKLQGGATPALDNETVAL